MAPESGERLTPEEAFEFLERETARVLRGVEGRLQRDEWGNARWVVRRDLSHLDSDAMNDRLHAWIRRDVEAALPDASAGVRWDHARPKHPHEAPDLEFEAEWVDVEPTFSLEIEHGTVTRKHLEAWVARVPEFLDVVGAHGRPEGWRHPDMGHAE